MVALLFCGDLKYCPYLKRYIERLEEKGIDYTVYFWNRSHASLELDAHYKYFDSYSKLKKGKLSKLFDFIKFRRWLIAQLRADRPEKLVLLSTLTGVFLSDYVHRNKSDYLFDIRDYSYEHVPPFYAAEKRVIRESAATVISSRGFCAFLPEHDYIIAHNFHRKEIRGVYRYQPPKGPIKVVWNGVMRYFEFQTQYLRALANDERFLMVYHGDGPDLEDYRAFCAREGIENVIFTGAYNNADKEALLSDAAILNNCYGYLGKSNKVKYAVSNRFYDGMIYHIPQVVEPEGYKTDWLHRAGIGVDLTPDEHFADRLYEYCTTIDAEAFDRACDAALSQVLAEDDRYIATIDAFIGG